MKLITRKKTATNIDALLASYIIFVAFIFSDFESLSALKHLESSYLELTLIPALCVYLFAVNRCLDLRRLWQFFLGSKIRIGILLLNIFAIFSAFLFKPNNWDSLTYHLPRIEHWLQNHTLTNYPTDISRQLWEPPFGDFLTAVPHALFGTDNFDALFSVISLMVFEISIYRILTRLGIHGDRLDCAIAIALTPMVVLESTTTQVDLRGAAIGLAAISLLLSTTRRYSLVFVLGIALAGGIKITSVIPLVPLFYLGIRQFRGIRGIRWFIQSIPFAVIGVCLNIPWMLRNLNTFGTLSGPASASDTSGFAILKIALSPGLYLARLTGFLFINIGQPKFNFFTHLLMGVANPVLSVYRYLDFPRSHYWPQLSQSGFGINEDLAPNSIVIATFLAVCIYLLIKRRFVVALFVASPLLLFNLFVEWQAFENRFFLGGFAVLGILIIFSLHTDNQIILRLLKYSAFTSLICSAIFLLFSGDRGVVRNQNFVFTKNAIGAYFNQQPSLAIDYNSLRVFLKNNHISKVNLQGGENSWEYPLWAMNADVSFRKALPGAQVVLCLDACPNFKKQTKPLAIFGKTISLYREGT